MTDAFELAWRLLKEEVEEEPPADPTPPPFSGWKRFKGRLKDMKDIMFGEGSLAERNARAIAAEQQRIAEHKAAFEAQQQAQQDAEMAREYGHQDPNQMSLDSFFGHPPEENKPEGQQLWEIE